MVDKMEAINQTESNEIESEFRQALYEYRDRPLNQDEATREIIITPFDGNYGRAGLMIVVNGSPPKGMLICTELFTNGWFIDAWNRKQRWERIFAPALHDRPASGKKARLGRATLDLLRAKGFVSKNG